ncbi:NTF2 fold immunity protein [Flavicella sediminum]|uniref:NTF2 fold immunity protein n=1 Tax=Flavicella sediminum TaxID=2585141 RepID=UPI00140AC701|nr:NTF2 fold immunity protein [Flavicella sediminum]
MKHILLCIFFMAVSSYGQTKFAHHRITLSEAKEILNESLTKKEVHNIIGSKPILTDRKKVIDFSEAVLFDIYGQKSIEKQKPYAVFMINNYWFIQGSHRKPWKENGQTMFELTGLFTMIIDARNYQIIRITHGK